MWRYCGGVVEVTSTENDKIRMRMTCNSVHVGAIERDCNVFLRALRITLSVLTGTSNTCYNDSMGQILYTPQS